MKTCPVSNHPIDIFTVGRGAYQVICPASHWMSALFTDIDDAIEYRANLDLAKVVAGAKRETSKDGVRMRLRGEKFFTEWMLPVDLNAFISAAGPAPAPEVKANKSRTSKAKPEPEPVKDDVAVE